MAQQIESARDILASVKAPLDLSLDTGLSARGIDNYHIDIEIGADLVLMIKQVTEEMVKRAVAGKSPTGNASDMEALRQAYQAAIKSSLHRTKTDLVPVQVQVMHFGLMKFVLQEIRAELDEVVKQVEESLSQQQFAGSRSLLVTQEHYAWLRKNYATFQLRAGRGLMKYLQREETNQLRLLRDQFLGDDLNELPFILFNPMLAAASPVDPNLLLESYALWPGGGKGISEANARLEVLLAKRIAALSQSPLKSADKMTPGEVEVYDELGGLFATQPFLGASIDQKELIQESFCWLEQPGNIRLLFDATVHERMAQIITDKRAQRSFNADAKKLQRIGQELRAAFVTDAEFKEAIAGYVIRDDWQPIHEEFLDIATACSIVAGTDTRKSMARIDQTKDGALSVIKKLEDWTRETNRAFKEDKDELSLRLLTDLSRFRLHLKYYRFAHRVFNRVKVITDAEQAHLSRVGGHLYLLGTSSQDDDGAPPERRIVHHTILKADVRGSTTVTRELIKQNLNPASYFSTRFFGPISDLLAVYGAVKVFIEGDAIILGIYEHEDAPQDWYSVARACGVAKDVLDIVMSKNTHSRQTGVPQLEVGIGICYSDGRPLFLFDDDKPIMISPAIGDADRLSSCSWKLRDSFEGGGFNVEVLEIPEGDRERGEKGQTHLRYNVNGITLSDEAFNKLKSEIIMKRLRVKVGERTETMLVGRFPDLRGKERELVIREGAIGVWQGEAAQVAPTPSGHFYEVLPNSRIAAQVLEMARNQAEKSS